MAMKAAKKNVTKEMAEMSGGEYTTFFGDKAFQARDPACGAGCAQPLSDHLQPVGPDAGAAFDSRADGGGLWREDCGEGELLGRCRERGTRGLGTSWGADRAMA